MCQVCGHAPAVGGGAHDCAGATGGNSTAAFPSEILPGFLFLGRYDHASRSDLLKILSVTHILNLVPTCDNLYKNSYEYTTASSKGWPFAEFNEAIERARAQGQRILVHCMSGRSRGPTAVVAYLMWRERWRLPAAYAYLRERHVQAHIAPAAASALQDYEAELFDLEGEAISAFPEQQAAGEDVAPVLPPSIFGPQGSVGAVANLPASGGGEQQQQHAGGGMQMFTQRMQHFGSAALPPSGRAPPGDGGDGMEL